MTTNGLQPEQVYMVEMLCPCGAEWVSESFEGELDRPDCEKCGGPGVRA